MHKGTSSIKAAAVTAIAVGSVVGISSGITVPAVLSFISGIAGTAALAPKLTEAYLPRIHNKIKSRF